MPHSLANSRAPVAGLAVVSPSASPALADRWRRRLNGTAGALASICFHATLLIAFALWGYQSPGGPAPGAEVRIAQLPEVELSDEIPELEADRQSEPMEMELRDLAPLSVADVGQLELVDVASPLGFGGQGELNSGALAGTGMAAQASFMGLQARGERFCIIADCSGSMRGGKIEHVKNEVLRTIGGLTGGTRFQILFFNNRAIPYPQTGWRRPVTELGRLRRWIDTITAGGGTSPHQAFQSAFELSPRPDAIFFMTDGQFQPDVVKLVAALNATGKRVPVNTITFVDRSAEPMMRSIASSSGGRYRHVAGF